jgi:hypothetical protein
VTTAAANPGLCADCRHAQRLAAKRTHYLRCRRSDDDRRFARYPRLPVLVCHGYEAGGRETSPGAPGALP